MKQEKPSRRRSSSRSNRSQQKEKETAVDTPVESSASEESAEEVNLSPEEAAEELQPTKRPFAEWQLLSEELKRGIAEQGYTDPTPVQTASFEPALEARDMVVQAKTGTGKTAGFGLPLLQRLGEPRSAPRVIILTPTRELAVQVAKELTALAKYTDLVVEAIYGGVSIERQIEALEQGVDVVVGTPGRVQDHIRRKTLQTRSIQTVVLDEADEMLSMGFYLEVSTIIEQCDRRKSLMLFSATVPPDIEGLVRQYTKKPIRLMVSGDDRRVTGIQHVGYYVDHNLPRPRNLLYVLENEAPESAIIFCNRRDDTSMVASYLLRHGKTAVAIHGDMNQHEREAVLAKIRKNEVQFMVATDVASRGIDISGLTHVFNYNFPHTMDLYIHRVGRTGRQGREGTAISLLDGADLSQLVMLKRVHKIFFDILELPPTNEMVVLAASRHIGELFGESMQQIIEPFLPLADALQLDPRGRYVVAHLLKMYYEGELRPLQPVLRKAQTVAQTDNDSTDGVDNDSTDGVDNDNDSDSTDGVDNDNDSDSTDSPDTGREVGEPANRDVRLYINIGSAEGFEEDSLCQMLRDEVKLPSGRFESVQVEKHHSFLNTDSPTSEKLLAAFQERKVGDFEVSIEIARKPRRRRRR